MIHSSDETDVGVSSITDRRRIRDLEKQVADLESKLTVARGEAEQLHADIKRLKAQRGNLPCLSG